MAEEEEKAAAPEEAAAEEEEVVVSKAAAPPPNNKLVMIILGLNAAVLIALVAVVMLGNKKNAQQVSLADVATSSEPASAAHGGGGHDAPDPHDEHGGAKKADPVENQFVKESFTVNLAESRGAHFAKVDVEIEVPEDFVRDELNRLKPRIRDFIVVLLSSKTFEQIESTESKDFLREEIRNKINGYLSRGQIKNVYFTQFIIQ